MEAFLAQITSLGPEFWSALIYVVAVAGICAIMLIGSALLGGKSGARARGEPFESGVVASSPEHLRLSAKFYLVAMFFVIFDVEALFLYAWAVSVKEAGWAGLIEVAVFIFILGASIVYLARIGALDWTPHQKKRRAARALRTQNEQLPLHLEVPKPQQQQQQQ